MKGKLIMYCDKFVIKHKLRINNNILNLIRTRNIFYYITYCFHLCILYNVLNGPKLIKQTEFYECKILHFLMKRFKNHIRPFG